MTLAVTQLQFEWYTAIIVTITLVVLLLGIRR